MFWKKNPKLIFCGFIIALIYVVTAPGQALGVPKKL
jgi:hypothetical protein